MPEATRSWGLQQVGGFVPDLGRIWDLTRARDFVVGSSPTRVLNIHGIERLTMVHTLLKNFTFVGDTGQSWATDWIAIPAEFQNWQLVIIVKSLISGSNLGYTLQTTWDTDSATNTSATGSLTAVGTTVTAISAGMGPMIRLLMNPAATSHLVFSVYLTPKST